jgi:hypothetical protein
VNTLAVVGPDDDVAERCAGLEDEDGIGISAFSLVATGRRTAVPLVHAAVKRGAGCDSSDGC